MALDDFHGGVDDSTEMVDLSSDIKAALNDGDRRCPECNSILVGDECIECMGKAARARHSDGKYSVEGAMGAEQATTASQHDAAAEYHDKKSAEMNAAKKNDAALAHAHAAAAHREAATGKSASEIAQMASHMAHASERGN